MRFLTRQDNQQVHNGGGGGPEGLLGAARAEGSQLLAAADQAIQQALGNSNSESFLRASQQHGGE